MKYTHIFFDLDHTLWDYEVNARVTLRQLYDQFELQQETTHGVDRFIEVFFSVNDALWQQYNHGIIDRKQIRERRFESVLSKLGIKDFQRKREMSETFLFQCPRQKQTMKGASDVLAYLKPKYHLSIVTNGFDDVQSIKLVSSDLDQYFSHVFTSENTGFKKPNRGIFDVAMKELDVKPASILMVGDNQSTDILGARNAGITPLLFNPDGKIQSDCELQVDHLRELIQLL